MSIFRLSNQMGAGDYLTVTGRPYLSQSGEFALLELKQVRIREVDEIYYGQSDYGINCYLHTQYADL